MICHINLQIVTDEVKNIYILTHLKIFNVIHSMYRVFNHLYTPSDAQYISMSIPYVKVL